MTSKALKLCNFCGELKILIDAHIVPSSYHPSNKGLLLQIEVGKKAKKILGNGHSDKDILCRSCDNKFGIWENYLKKYCLGKEPWDYKKIKLAILSILWKAHITTLPDFHDINLGPLGEEIFNLIKNEDPSTEKNFPI